MATKKKAAKKKAGKKKSAAVGAAVLRFNPRWFSDPPPPFFRNLDRAVIRQLAALKTDFAKRVNEVLRKG